MKKTFLLLFGCAIYFSSIAQTTDRFHSYNIAKDKVLYTVGYAHLDTEWNWDYPASINIYIKNMLTENFHLFELYPDYVFNFTGSRRYHFMKEYYPDMFKTLQGYIKQGRWHVAGSSVDEAEANMSSSESIIRQVLYGNEFFRKNFDTVSYDYMIPDCFGFVANLPTVLNYCGLKGFSTQKLTWRSANGIPFNVGVWNGPDDKGVVAALNATDYGGHVVARLDKDTSWDNRLEEDRKRTGYAFDYRYYGVGDQGGAPRKTDVVHAVGSLNNPDSKFKVLLSSADQMFKDVTPEIRKNLPTYKGDLLLIEHSSGSSTSQAYMKRMNRKNELLAQSAETAASMAELTSSLSYPKEKLDNAWELVLGSQFHDILPGTAIPKAYEYAWNDEFIAANNFSSILKNSIANISNQLNTKTVGRSVLVYNPVAREREDVVTATLQYNPLPENIAVYDYNGKQILSQITKRLGDTLTFIFLAKLPATGVAVFDVRETKKSASFKSLAANNNVIENEFYKVTIAENGDLTSVYDKKNAKELLSSPAKLEFLHEAPSQWPSWNMDWKDRKNPPVDFLDKNATVKIIEQGPVRTAIEITREGKGSTIQQTVNLSAGEAGKRVDIDNKINWHSQGVSLKAAFPLTVSDSIATYNLGAGTIARANNVENKFEVPSKQWFDLTDVSKQYGVTILEDCKYGSDKPNDNTVRLTLMYTPEINKNWTWCNYQGTQDFGVHHFKYGIYGHEGDWQKGLSQWQAQFFNQPLIAFEVPKHWGRFGKVYSFINISSPQVGVMAVKKQQNGDYYIVRVNELSGKDLSNVSIGFGSVIEDAYEVNGQEQKIGNANFSIRNLTFDISHYTIKSFAVKLKSLGNNAETQTVVDLPYNKDVMSFDDNRTDGSFDDDYTLPAELVPGEIVSDNIHFKMGDKTDEKMNAVACNQQQINLPAGNYNKLYLLAAANDDTKGEFLIDGKSNSLSIQSFTGFVGQFYNRHFTKDFKDVTSIDMPFAKRDNIAWFATHTHYGYPSENVAYKYSYMYKYEINIPAGAKTITLPKNDRIKILAMTVANSNNDDITELQPLYDDFKGDGEWK